MVTLLASLAGFISSIFPEILKLIKDSKDKKHELAIFDRQLEIQKSGINSRMQELAAYTDIAASKALYKTYKTGIYWVDALNGTVRPVLAYSFFMLYAAVKYLQYSALSYDIPLAAYLDILWNQDDQAIFAGITSFYFGQRSLSKLRGNK